MENFSIQIMIPVCVLIILDLLQVIHTQHCIWDTRAELLLEGNHRRTYVQKFLPRKGNLHPMTLMLILWYMFVQRRRNKEVERSNKMYYFDLNDLKKKKENFSYCSKSVQITWHDEFDESMIGKSNSIQESLLSLLLMQYTM